MACRRPYHLSIQASVGRPRMLASCLPKRTPGGVRVEAPDVRARCLHVESVGAACWSFALCFWLLHGVEARIGTAWMHVHSASRRLPGWAAVPRPWGHHPGAHDYDGSAWRLMAGVRASGTYHLKPAATLHAAVAAAGRSEADLIPPDPLVTDLNRTGPDGRTP